MTAFGVLVRSYRQHLGLTQEELAHRCGLSVRGIGKVETGRITLPRPQTVRLLADAFGLVGEDRQRFCRSAHEMPPGGPPVVPVPAQLPPSMSGFVAREKELRVLDRLIASVSPASTDIAICVISGTAGVGKTTLAVHWARRVADRYPDGQLYVNLHGYDPAAPAMNPFAAVRAFLDALGVAPDQVPVSSEAQVGLYRTRLAGRRILLLLDNAQTAEQVRPLLPSPPGCLALVTSRNRLDGLVAADGAQSLVLDLPTPEEARRILCGRLGGERMAAEPWQVERIIDRCARLPLALAVVAARAAASELPLAALVDQLGEVRDGLDPFTGDDPATDVRAVFSWSYHALSTGAAELFRLLGGHPGQEIGLPAAASLGGVTVARARALLDELTRTHLVAERTPGRFHMHDLLRAYAGELFRAAGGRPALHRMLDHYLHTARAADRLLDPFREPIHLDAPVDGVVPEDITDHERALAWFTTEYASVFGAVTLAAKHGFDGHTWRLTRLLVDFFQRSGQWQDMVSAHRAALAAAERLDERAGLAYTHRGLGRAYVRTGEPEAASVHYGLALDLFTALKDRIGQGHVHRSLATLANAQGRHGEALDHACQAIELFRAAGEDVGHARALNAVGWYRAHAGDFHGALSYCRKALVIQSAGQDRFGRADTCDSLGYVYHRLGQHDRAVDCYRQAVALFRDLGDRYLGAASLSGLGDSLAAAGDPAQAEAAWRTALVVLDDLGHADADTVRAKLQAHGRGWSSW
jgi:tetratricopeptide (TPR) repeat protein/DNA-binding XRE family transcriptional regulator